MAPQVVHRAAITTPKEAGGLLRAIEGFEGFKKRKPPLNFLRTFSYDLESCDLLNGRVRLRQRFVDDPCTEDENAAFVQRSTFATGFGIIGTIRHDASHSKYLLPSLRSVAKPMSENTINAALRRLGFAQDEMTGHGFRAMAATLLNEMGMWNPDAIERQLAHCDNNSVRRAYTRGEYWNERIRMMQHWSDHLDLLQGGVKGSKGRV